MKKILCTALVAVTMLSVLAGCQKTPDTPIVIGKDQDAMLASAVNGGENSSLLSTLEVPERFTGDWTGVDDCVTVHADATVTLPQASGVPTATVTRHSFSQADADMLLEAFLKGNTLYEEQGVTRQIAMEQLEKFQAMQNGEIPISGDTKREDLPGLIEYYAQLARTAPDENERVPAPMTFQSDTFYDEVIAGCAEVDGKTVHISIHNFSEYYDEAIVYQEGYGDLNNCNAYPLALMEEPAQTGISETQAEQMGDALMESLGLSNVICDQSTAVAFVEYDYSSESMQISEVKDTGYELQYVRTVQGFPIAYTPFLGNYISDNEEYVGSWAYERLTVYVSENGIVYFHWINPYTEPVVQTDDTQLLRFSDVADIFGKMIIVKNSELKAANEANGFVVLRNIEVSDVRLSLMRIRSKGNFSEGLLVPVWDFWGTTASHTKDPAYSDMVYGGEDYTIVLTVNAIDGTIIDRDLGY